MHPSSPAYSARARTRLISWLLIGGGILAGILTGAGTVVGHPEAAFVLLGLALPVLAWRYPYTVIWVIVGVAALVEQFPLNFPDRVTDRIPLFRSLSSLGLAGLQVTPLEIAVAVVLVISIARAASERRFNLPRSPVAAGMAVFLAIVIAYEGYGIARSGNLQASIWELRGWFYLAALFLMAASLFTKRGQVTGLLWVIVIGSGLKGVQGSVRYLFFTRNMYPPPNSILEHEEAFMFAVFIALTACLWLFGVRGRLRAVATILLPVVLLADLANNRRTAWIIFGASIVVLLLVAYLRLPDRRHFAILTGVLLSLVSVIYLPLFWNGTGVAAQPARALASAFTPDARDASSDLYRLGENYDLQVLIKKSPLIGAGFGQVIPKAIPVWDATQVDPLIDYIPHNQILYLWLRVGIVGAIAFWWMIGMAFEAACRLTRMTGDRTVLVVATVTICALVGYLTEAWFDQGLVAVRITIVLGALLGAVQFLLYEEPRLAANRAARRWGAATHRAERVERVADPLPAGR